MDAENPAGVNVADPPKSTASVASPARKDTSASIVGPNPGTTRTEKPIEPKHLFRHFTKDVTEEAAIGSPEYVFSLKLNGNLGVFYERVNTTLIPTGIEMDFDAYRIAIYHTLYQVLEEQLIKKAELDEGTRQNLAQSISQQLTNGVAVMTYLKLRSVNYHDSSMIDRYLRKPKVPSPFVVPEPYALAISQLGQVKVSGLTTEVYYTPTAPATIGTTFGAYANLPWSPLNYSHAVKVATDLGLRFTAVDLEVKMGSSWWLYLPDGEGDDFNLTCPLPEENFTKNTAVLAGLFCRNDTGGLLNPIFNLDVLEVATYGTMFRAPPADISANVFCAISAGFEDVYSIVN